MAIKICHCGTQFETKTVVTYCSDACRPRCSLDGCEGVHFGRGYCAPHYKLWWLYGAPEHPTHTIECCVCGVEFLTKYVASSFPNRYCSSSCYNKVSNVRNKEGKRSRDARRRCAENNGIVIDLQLIFDIYNGCCYLCGDELDPDNWQIEHLQPISKGGKHEYANVAPAHKSCNVKKHAKTLVEYFQLIGGTDG